MRSYCHEAGDDEAVDQAAHALHRTHVSWSHSAISTDPTSCYQCHVFARIVARELAIKRGASDETDIAPSTCGDA